MIAAFTKALREILSATFAELGSAIKAVARGGAILMFWCATACVPFLIFRAVDADRAISVLAVLRDVFDARLIAEIWRDGPSAMFWGIASGLATPPRSLLVGEHGRRRDVVS